MDYKKHIKEKLSLLPDLPGCYMMKDAFGEIIYIGKAKNLKNRVNSYFRGAHDGKTLLLVNDIRTFETIVTRTNKEALLLEINLIQKYQPKYNIKLKETTMYPYLKITKEKDPQMMITNHVEKDGGLYFGPYPNVGAANQTLQLLQKSYPLRRCSKQEKRACFYYHIHQCIGCCDHPVPKEEYDKRIKLIQRFLNGDVSQIKKELRMKMQEAAEELAFERAGDYRDQIHYIETTVEKQIILSKDYSNHDVFGYFIKNGLLSIQVFLLRQSSIIKREATIFECYGNPEDEVLSYILQFYLDKGHILPKEIIVPDTLDKDLLADTLGVKVITPKRNKKRSLLDLTIKNSEIAVNERIHLETLKDTRSIKAVDELAHYLGIQSANTIESFDHSNTQGTNPVSAMVVYKNGIPDKKAYRKFKIKTVVGSHEFATTQEVIRRRYSRLLKENKPMPDLILMDGGAIQVNAAKEVLEDELGLQIAIAGMVKNDKHQTASLIFGDDLHVVDLPIQSPAFRLIQRIQEEVHRFAITFHRQLRSKHSLSSQLDNIEGVGPKTKKKLLVHFRTLKELKEASLEDFKHLGISKNVANNLYHYFKSIDNG
ncbi:excinuclease ABC subunit UvrC [Carnobacteriaceae bacterium zg-ZUI78]|uniref:excinuclease ABC subunit UvrC n=1 Tax=Granulicatella sp. zg-84 TaxID=2678503 RepID=UPI0013C0C0FA|nr:excinuclease ABC subunit UvrC [Granulicatella sp. zg-84]MBS4750449.1 excinuclease ABC subunit UvrC [Carnobacteriaceae bacterium zg-ZUI78]NEW65450.1 excinuclease ABC subunit UvrC [Granulicatella sp. zg-84]QMI85246.1 excinuclease ABC subunit UvrC [Carnobacteriaceae bacterium zg-84]